jgi:nitrogen regulatory protein P-II 2
VVQSRKFVVAMISPFKLGEVLDALERVGAQMPTVTEARGYGQKGHTEIYRGAEYTPNFVPMIKMEIDVPSDQVDQVTEAIAGAAASGQIGEVKIFVFSLEQAVHVPVDKSPIVPLRAA